MNQIGKTYFLIPRIKFLPPNTAWMSSPASSSLKTRSRVKLKSEECLFRKVKEDKRRKIRNLTKGVFDGELEKPAEVLSWLDDLLTGADIEQVSVEMMIIIRNVGMKF